MKLQWDSESKAACLIHLSTLEEFVGSDFLVEDLYFWMQTNLWFNNPGFFPPSLEREH